MALKLQGWRFSTKDGALYKLQAVEDGYIRSKEALLDEPQRRKFWRPVLVHPVAVFVLLSLVLLTVIALELLLRFSNKNNGFASVSNTLGTYSWSYIAPAYLFLLGLLLQAYTFAVRTLEPYVGMHREPQTARRSVTYTPLNRTTVGLLGHAIKHRSVVGLACASSMLIIPFLKIVVAGLFVTSFEPTVVNTQVLSTGTFNGSTIFPDSFQSSESTSGDFMPAQVLALSQIPKYDLPLPTWTTANEAVGEVNFDSIQFSTQSNMTVVAPLPVVRADLSNCSTLTSSDYNILPQPNSQTGYYLQIPLQPVTNDARGTSRCVFNGDIDTLRGQRENATLPMPSQPG
ncbi:hypothetical protein PLICRDRAFT_345163 [Plicaturopsis crispa FD-325 SS-3]|uniref:Uncharacterized protein n=1 Tax=Plicaturopsis crispa FD-325 SS-3 TaxID=944288 RepID=A0A0C9SRP4_PLICR|nr:hypothetical protein PLICRDRAFT_345163 [Plicaturopsis crispa FD-325 SS-3]